MNSTLTAGVMALACSATMLASSVVHAEQLAITHFSIADGLPHSRVVRVYQDSHGFIWFCTGDGLSRFDGYGFRNYSVDSGLPYPSLSDFVETADGEYWIATNGGGVVRFNPDSTAPASEGRANTWFTTYRLSSEPSANRVNVFFQDRERRLWVGTDGGLFRLDRQRGEVQFHAIALGLAATPDRTVQVWAMAEDGDGTLWIGTRYGLVRRRASGETVQYRIAPQAATDHVWALLFDPERRLWMGHSSGLLIFRPGPADHDRERAGSTTAAILPIASRRGAGRAGTGATDQPLPIDTAHRFTAADGLAGENVTALRLSSSGSIWIGSRGQGITEYAAGRFRAFTRAHGLSNTVIQSITEDRGGNIWVGSLDGAMRIAVNGFVTYSEPDGVGEVTGKLFERDGFLYAASHEFRISRFDGRRFTSVTPPLPASITGWRANHGVVLDHLGEWWMATREGLYRFPRVARFERLAHTPARAVYTQANGLVDDDVTHIFEDRRGDLWIGHFAPEHEVLTRWERSTGTFHRYSTRRGLAAGSALQAITESPSGDLWMGFRGGELVRYDGQRFESVLPGGGSPPRAIGGLHFESAERLWVALQSGGGVLRIDQPDRATRTLKRYTTADGLTSDNTSCLTRDARGLIYVVTAGGVDRLDPASGHVRRYSVADGVSNTECSTALLARDGSLWFNTAKGFLRFVPRSEAPLAPPRVLIGRVQIAGQDESVPARGAISLGPLSIAANQNRVHIEFFALSPDLRGSPRYQYRLENAGEDWSPPTNQRQITYANLAPNRYKFVVRALDASGTPSVAPASLEFTVLAPVWQRWWFLSGVAALLTTFGYSLHRRRVSRAVELERVRTRIATDLHDEVGSGLSQVSLLSEIISRQVGPDPAFAEPLARIATVSRDLVDSMNDIVWAINPGRDHLADLTHRMRRFASDVLGPMDIDLRFEAPDSADDRVLGADVRREVWLMFKEAVNNVVRHARCSNVEVRLVISHGELELTVKDNGRGFDLIEAQGRDGNGINSMQRRARRLGGRVEFHSRPNHGTVVTCRAPVKHRRWRQQGYRW